MSEGFYSKKSVFGIPNALIFLMVIFFCVPFAGRGARMALQKTENNVKDWLPSDFRETEELSWFAKKFVSEQFIVATWENCREGDQRLRMFLTKLRSEQAPQIGDESSLNALALARLGDDVKLFVNDDDHFDWGGKQEKWLSDGSGQAYYITPSGRLYRWEGNPNIVGAAVRSVQRSTGSFELKGQFVAQLGEMGTEAEPNPFWNDIRLVAAPLFKTVETGQDTVDMLAGAEDGPLYSSSEPTAGKRDAIKRLTGTLFGPPAPAGFQWQANELPPLLDEATLAALPDGWEATWDLVIKQFVDKNFEGDLAAFKKSDPATQADAWYAFFDQLLIPPPPRQTCVVLTLTDAGRENLGRVIGRGMLGQPKGRLFEIAEECGVASPPKPTTAPPPFSWLAASTPIPSPMLRIGGPPVDNVAIDEEGTITLVRLIGYSLALGLGLSFLLLRSVRLMMMVFFVGGVSAMASLGLVWWGAASVDAILLTMPSLVYVLGMAGAIHIVNYYRDAVIEGGQEGAAERAISHAVMPCTLAAITTAIGLVSLCSSNILPIRKFGIFSAMGVIATLVLLYVFLPSALTIFPPKIRAIKETGKDATSAILRFWEAIGRFIFRFHWYVNAICITAFLGLGYGLLKIETDVQLLKLFDSKSQIISDYAWLEKNFGRLVPMELVVRYPVELQQAGQIDDGFSKEDERLARTQLDFLERAEAVTKIQKILQQKFGHEGKGIVGTGMSATTFLRDAPEPTSGLNVFRLSAKRLLLESRDQLLESDYMAIEDLPEAPGTELWRISLRLGALNDVDYGQFVSSLQAVVEPIVASYRCRREILGKIVNDPDNTRLVGSVLVLGTGRPRDGVDGLGDLNSMPLEEQQLKIFAASLQSSLINQTVAENKGQNWADPALVEGDEAKFAKWLDGKLDSCDCVILLKSDPAFDLDYIKKNAKSFVDAEAMLADVRISLQETDKELDRPVAVSAFAGDMDVVYTGVVPVVYKAQRTLLVSLFESVGWAFVLIAFVMMCLLSPAKSFLGAFKPRNVLQSVGSGAISMIPNVFPVVVIFGLMGHIGRDVDIGSMMTASVAMGVAVDDTIHFLTWFRTGLRRGLDRREALFVAYRHVAPAMTQTTIIGGLGLSVFALSTFTPTQQFGKLMLALLAAALVGDLIFLPALLASPLGRIFSLGNGGKQNKEDQADGTLTLDQPASIQDVEPSVDGEYQLAPEEHKPPVGSSVPPPQMLRRDGANIRRRI